MVTYASTRTFRADILQFLPVPPAAARGLMDDAQYRTALIRNSYLDVASWRQAFAYPLTPTQLALLVERPLTGAHLDWLIAQGVTPDLMAEAVGRVSVLTPAHVEALLATKGAQTSDFSLIVASVMKRRTSVVAADPRAVASLMEMAEGTRGTGRLAAFTHLADQDTAARWFATFDRWAPTVTFLPTAQRKLVHDSLSLALIRLPGLLPVYASANGQAQTLAARHRCLTDRQMHRDLIAANSVPARAGDQTTTLRALIGNPAVALDLVAEIASLAVLAGNTVLANEARLAMASGRPTISQRWRDVTDPAQIDYLYNRTAPSSDVPFGRPADAAELLANPLLTRHQQQTLLQMLTVTSPRPRGNVARAAMRADPELAADLARRFAALTPVTRPSRPAERPEPAAALSLARWDAIGALTVDEIYNDRVELGPELGQYLAQRLVTADGEPHVVAWLTALTLAEDFGDVPVDEWISATLAAVA